MKQKQSYRSLVRERNALRTALKELVFQDSRDGCWYPRIREGSDVTSLVGKLLKEKK